MRHADEIVERLWMGSMFSLREDLDRFDLLVLAADSFQPTAVDGWPEVHRAPFVDGQPEPEDVERAIVAARRVADVHNSGGSALVTCLAGQNRSGFIVALAMRLSLRVEPADAIDLIRERRNAPALHNADFVHYILNLSNKVLRGA